MRKSARTQIPPFFDNDPYGVLPSIKSSCETTVYDKNDII